MWPPGGEAAHEALDATMGTSLSHLSTQHFSPLLSTSRFQKWQEAPWTFTLGLLSLHYGLGAWSGEDHGGTVAKGLDTGMLETGPCLGLRLATVLSEITFPHPALLVLLPQCPINVKEWSLFCDKVV